MHRALIVSGANVEVVTNGSADLDRFDGVVLPGVGATGPAMATLSRNGLVEPIRQFRGPLLAVCVGMQVLFDYSVEDDTVGLQLLAGTVRKLTSLPLPHMGWNDVEHEADPLFGAAHGGTPFYFVHSFALDDASHPDAIGTTTYGDQTFVSAGHVFGKMDAVPMTEAVVIGLSMGGYVALAMAREAPGRVQALGLIGSKPDPDTPEAKQGRDRQAESVVADGPSSLVAPLTTALLADASSIETRARLRTMIEHTSTETYVSALRGMRDRPDTTDVITSFSGPIAVMVGEKDPLVTVERNAEIAGLARDGVAVPVPDSGHLVPMEDPRAVALFIADLVARL